jgi:pimeloyl-ACP methyl ester carboxylesterase
MGGTVASLYAGARPARVERLAIVDGLGLHDGGPDALDRLVKFLDGAKDEPVNKVFPDLAAAAARLRHSNPSIDEAWSMRMAARITRPVEGGVTWTWDARHRIRGAVPYRHAHHQVVLRAIACPTLVVVPELSPFQPADIDALAGAIPGAQRASIPGAGHMVHLEAPAALVGVLAPFLSGA